MENEESVKILNAHKYMGFDTWEVKEDVISAYDSKRTRTIEMVFLEAIAIATYYRAFEE